MPATARRRTSGLAAASLTTFAVAVVALGGAPSAAALPSSAPSSSPSSSTPPSPGVSTLMAADDTAQQAAADFWTADRIAAAQPASTGEVTGGGPAATVAAAEEAAGSAPTTASGVTTLAAGDPPTLERGTRQAAGVVTGDAVSESTTWTQASPATAKVGRLYFTRTNAATGADELFECSASSVESGNGSVLVTAGHCLTQNGVTSGNVVFIPGMNGTTQPYGRWTAQTTFATNQWATGNQASAAALNYDVGFVVVGTKNGRTLADTVGTFGIGFDSRLDRVTVFGYPAGAGNVLKYCTGYRFSDPDDTDDQGTLCRMTGGSSGGPWLSGLDAAAGTGTVTSVVSFSYDEVPEVLYGPRFGDVVRAEYDKASAVTVS